MTMYEVIMIMLAFLILIVSLLTLVVKMLLIIIDKNAKKYLPRSRQKFEVIISNIQIQGQPLTGCSFFHIHYSLR